ncbi:MAG TPA: response regulator, partial [Chitinophagaceae bacterium]|nr:response regulator [Chitinophagaceae bacterium]
MKILIIEDEPDLMAETAGALQGEGYLVETAADYDAAREKLAIYAYDCVVLDIGLPGGSGLSLLKELKEEGKDSGVIIVSAKGSLDDKIRGLD